MGPTMAQMVRQQPVVTDPQGQSQVIPCGICVVQTGTTTGIPLIGAVCPCQYDAISVHSLIYHPHYIILTTDKVVQ